LAVLLRAECTRRIHLGRGDEIQRGMVLDAPLTGITVETFLFIGLVWLLWYLVSVEVSGRGQSILTSKVRFRIVADVLAMLFGVALSVMGFNIYERGFGFVTTYSTLVSAPYFLWALAIVAFYGHDLWVAYFAAWELQADEDRSK
jgi:hypothetical protein